MHFETLQTISVNGCAQKPNDDRCGATARLAWVIDGATDMGPPGLLGQQGGASWLASTASNAFAATQADDVEATCHAVFTHIEDRFERQKTREVAAPWEVPKAAFGVAQLTSHGLSVAWAADSPILHISGQDVRWCTGEPDTSAEAADARALGPGIGAAAELPQAVLDDRRAHRARNGHVALSSDAKASSAATRFAHHPISVGDELLLMSDGFASLVTDYER
ncbi:protein phosphatase 2C domain-containing protein [Pontivivens ytuae]|uniref:Protein phosphatase 2C domain-containing protein n=1 Tax=Pontivivens ytuae TaxID=2789856 RepID=A0A7S9LSU7_9RHOB|nr:protein phosphatase 2C domain-containing protein [Pontivivens ytuae]QPH54521.1 protein phosphatase 2C domain-containing protein [Pontivivens ytuae]